MANNVRRAKVLGLAVAMVVGGMGLSGVRATPIDWSGAGDANWSNSGNWVGGAVPTNDLTTDVAQFVGGLTNQPNVDAATSVSGLVIGDNSGAPWPAYTPDVTLSGQQLSLGAGGLTATSNTGNVWISAPIHVAADQTWTCNINTWSGGSNAWSRMAVSGALTGTGNLTINGSGNGSLSLQGDNSQYSGTVTLNSGTLGIRYNYNWVNGNAVFVPGSGTLGTGQLVINGGQLNVTQDAWIHNTVALTNSSQVWNGSFSVISNGYNGSWPDFSGDMNMGTGSVTMNNSITVTVDGWSKAAGTWWWAPTNCTVGGAIGDNGTGYGLTMAGGGNLILAGANTYSGPTSVTGAGNLDLANSLALQIGVAEQYADHGWIYF